MTAESGQPVVTAPSGGERDEAFCTACGLSFPPELDKCPNDGARLIKLAARRDVLIGRVFEGRYEVRGQLGAGGMGTVYRGWQLSVDREVAIKVIDPRLSSDRVAVKRFLREARLASRLNQPNIINVYDFGQTDDGILYIAMELVRGKTLAQELAAAAIPVRRAAGLIMQLCDALEAAHAQTIVHRDLKPGNIIVLDEPAGRDLIKVLDFGLAKSLTGEALSQVTKTDSMLGTPLYMAPEQIDGKPSDQRADLYSAGCIFYEMLAGRPPFVDHNMHGVLDKHLSQPPPPLPPAVPPSVAKLITAMLAKQPKDRPQSAIEVRRALQLALDGGSAIDVRAIARAAAEPAATAAHGSKTATSVNAMGPTLDSDQTRSALRERAVRRRVALVSSGAVVVVVAVVAIALNTSKASNSTPPPQARAATLAPAVDAAAASIDAHADAGVVTDADLDGRRVPANARAPGHVVVRVRDAGAAAVPDAAERVVPIDAPGLGFLYKDAGVDGP